MVVIGIILVIVALFLTIAVIMQHGKSHNLSGTIAGASETFFGKSKATTVDRKLSTFTSIVAVVFVVLVLVAYLVQGGTTSSSNGGTSSTKEPTQSEETTDETAE